MALIIVISLLLITYLASLIIPRRRKLGYTAIKRFRIVIIVTTILLVTVLTAENFNLYPRWYWFTKMLFWTCLLAIMGAYAFCRKEVMNKYERGLYKMFFLLPALAVALLFIPFIGFALGLLFYPKFIGYPDFILYNDNRIRIEQPGFRFLGPDLQPEIYVKGILTASRQLAIPVGFDYNRDTLDVNKINDSVYRVTIRSAQHRDFLSADTSFKYTLRSSGLLIVDTTSAH